MKIDAVTKAKYVAWKRRKILKRILFLLTCLFILWGGFFLGSTWCGREQEEGANENANLTVSSPSDPESEELDESDEPVLNDITEEPDAEETRGPVVFCGAADPEDAISLTDDEALSYLALVNRCYRVSSEFKPDDLSVVNVESVNLNWGPHHWLRESAARGAEALFAAAAEEGLILLASSAHRTHDNQTFYFEDNVRRNGLETAMRVSAVPGHSEHQLGLALDVTTHALNGGLTQAFTETPEGNWVNQNAHRFGFIISYPQGREEDTGFIYEPWHIRYVGVEVATVIFNHGLILEEYLWYYSE